MMDKVQAQIATLRKVARRLAADGKLEPAQRASRLALQLEDYGRPLMPVVIRTLMRA